MLGRFFVVLCTVAFLQACTTEQIVENSTIPSSENGAFALGRYFMAAKAPVPDGGLQLYGIYEVIDLPDGTYETRAVVERDDCEFMGLTSHSATLYAVCSAVDPSAAGAIMTILWSELVRIELWRDEDDPARVITTRLEGTNMLPNGMTVHWTGDIFISNSYAVFAPMLGLPGSPALIRVSVEDYETFQIAQEAVLQADQGGYAPNGVQIKGDRLWMASFNHFFQATITPQGLEDMNMIYEAESHQVLDDFAVLPNGTLAICELTNPWPDVAAIFYPDVIFPEQPVNQLTFVATRGRKAGDVVHVHSFDPTIMPSSALGVVDRNGPALYVTDYLLGGLYRVAP